MTRTDHDDFDGMAVGWVLHALEPDEEQAFAEHLATCDACQRVVRESEETLGSLAYDVPLVDPPEHLLERIREATGAVDAVTITVSHGEDELATVAQLPRRVLRRQPRWALSAVAAGLVLVALLGWNVVLQSRVGKAQDVATQRQVVISELARSSTRAVLTDPADRTVGYVVQSGTGIDIVASGLTPNDRVRSTYVLWALKGSGEPPTAIGRFDIVKDSMDVRRVSGNEVAPETFTGFAVSKEPGRSLPRQPSQVVATGAVLG